MGSQGFRREEGPGGVRRRDEVAGRFAGVLVRRLIERKFLEVRGNEAAAREAVRRVLLENLLEEERLETEAREILQGHSKEIRDSAADYSRLFNLVKGKLARDRGFVL